MRKKFWLLFVVTGLLLNQSGPVDAKEISSGLRFPEGHPDAGLPISEQSGGYYAKDKAHPLNRLHQLLFIAELVPEEISLDLPREKENTTEAERPWYFRKRPGTPADRRLFGGDVRVSPVLQWSEERTAALLETVESLLADSPQNRIASLAPLEKLLVQWDVLSVWWRLEQQAETPPVVLAALARLVQATAQPAETLQSLPSGWNEARQAFAKPVTPMVAPAANAPYFSADNLLEESSNWVELSRRSTKLFLAPQSLRASRVFLKLSAPTELKDWIAGQWARQNPETGRPAEQIETAMVLSLIGITPEGKPVATPVIDEIRFRTAFADSDPVNLEETTSRDGSTLWVYFIDRQQTQAEQSPRYRFVRPDSQAIFPEYGTAKQATYMAQCTLCHRLTNSGNQAPAGVRSLSTVASAQIQRDPSYQKRLAELQMEMVATRLKTRLETGAVALEPAVFHLREVPRELPE